MAAPLLAWAASSASLPRAGAAAAPGDVLQFLDCGLCLGLLRQPVTLPCGHHFCQPCLRQLVAAGPPNDPRFSCPMDRHTFPKTFPLFVSIALQNIVASVTAAAAAADAQLLPNDDDDDDNDNNSGDHDEATHRPRGGGDPGPPAALAIEFADLHLLGAPASPHP